MVVPPLPTQMALTLVSKVPPASFTSSAPLLMLTVVLPLLGGAVGATGVDVGGSGVLVGNTGVLVAVGGIAVVVGETGVLVAVGGMDVLVGATGVLVGDVPPVPLVTRRL